MNNASVYNPVEVDFQTIRQGESPMPAKVLHDLAAMLKSELSFAKVRAIAPREVPGQLPPIAPGEVLILAHRRGALVAVDQGGSRGTMGVRNTKRLTIALHGILGSVQTPYAQHARMADDLPIYVARAISANALLPDSEGNNQLTYSMRFFDDGMTPNFRYGSTSEGKALFFRSCEMRVEADLIYWFTAYGNVGAT